MVIGSHVPNYPAHWWEYKNDDGGAEGTVVVFAKKHDLPSATGEASLHGPTSRLGGVKSDPLRPLIRKARVVHIYVTTGVGGAPTSMILTPPSPPRSLTATRLTRYRDTV